MIDQRWKNAILILIISEKVEIGRCRSLFLSLLRNFLYFFDLFVMLAVPLQMWDFLFAKKGVYTLNGFKLLHVFIDWSEFIERVDCFIDDFLKRKAQFVSLNRTAGKTSINSLSCLIEMVLSSLRKKNQFRIFTFPKLNEPIELESSHIFDIWRIDSDWNSLLRMDKAINDSQKGVQTVYLFEESLSISLELVKMVRREYIDKKLIQVHSSQHRWIG